jgi:hypothetical protein
VRDVPHPHARRHVRYRRELARASSPPMAAAVVAAGV